MLQSQPPLGKATSSEKKIAPKTMSALGMHLSSREFLTDAQLQQVPSLVLPELGNLLQASLWRIRLVANRCTSAPSLLALATVIYSPALRVRALHWPVPLSQQRASAAKSGSRICKAVMPRPRMARPRRQTRLVFLSTSSAVTAFFVEDRRATGAGLRKRPEEANGNEAFFRLALSTGHQATATLDLIPGRFL